MDKTFGIRYRSVEFTIRDKVIKIQGGYIERDGEIYMGTLGL